MMGGPGSGRQPDKRCVAECRVLSVGALLARSRHQRRSAGECPMSTFLETEPRNRCVSAVHGKRPLLSQCL
jgi:hypothetical protein